MASPPSSTKLSTPPVVINELFQLTSLGIAAEHITYKSVNLQSSKYICVREEGKIGGIAIIDTATKDVLRFPLAVDSAMMHPTSKVVALRATTTSAEGVKETTIQLFDLEKKTRVKSTTLNEATVVFWKWLDTNTIVMVTNTSVYHWNTDGTDDTSAPVRIFARAPADFPVLFRNYRMSFNGKWCMIHGLTNNAMGQPIGWLQVYSVAMKISQPTMDSHAACFASTTIDGRDAPSNLFCFTKMTPQHELQLVILEIDVPRDQTFMQQCVVKLNAEDYPIALLPHQKHGCLFLLTKKGMVQVYEIQSGKCIHTSTLSAVTPFIACDVDTTIDAKEGGIVTIDQYGRVAHLYIDESQLHDMTDSVLAAQMTKRFNITTATPPPPPVPPRPRPSISTVAAAASAPATATGTGTGGDGMTLTEVKYDTPPFWAIEREFDDWLNNQMECYNKERTDAKLRPITFRLTEVSAITNPKLEAQFANAIQRLIAAGRDEKQLCIERAFHGTHPRNIEAIATNGLLRIGHPLNPSTSKDIGSFGASTKGIYVSRKLDYCLQYSNRGEPLEPKDQVKVLVFDVLPGASKHITEMKLGMDPTPGYDSHSSANHQEWYLFNEDQCMPRMVLTVRAFENRTDGVHDTAADNSAEPSQSQSSPTIVAATP